MSIIVANGGNAMSKMTAAAKKVGAFMKKNAFYLLIVLCIASVATVIALAATGDFGPSDSGTPVINPSPDDSGQNTDTNPDDSDKDPTPDKETLSFQCPVNGTVSQEYSDTVLVWNETLAQFQVHAGVDFVADDLSVFASEKGTVSEVGYDYLNGHYVTVDHEDGYQTRYYSLDENLQVEKGDTVVKGQLLGTMSASRGSESLAGNHLHFEMSKDGKTVNPLEVLILEEK